MGVEKMKAKSLKPFNVLGVTSSKIGETLEIDSVVTLSQLVNMKLVEVLEAETSEAPEAPEAKEAKPKRVSK
jgi:hypothetical protein